MKFLIQTVDNEISHDFCFYMKEAIQYQNWYNKDNPDYEEIIYSLHEEVPYDYNIYSDYIPIGTVEFVHGFYKRFFAFDDPKPINVPEQFRDKSIIVGDKQTVLNYMKLSNREPFFVKSHTRIKDDTHIVGYSEMERLKDDIYFARYYLDIDSEWRVFVFNKRIVGAQNYSGDCTLFPYGLVPFVNDIIRKYDDQPPAYTVDIGINGKEDEIYLIEMHNFYACGFYGFNDQRIIPQMFSQWHHWWIRTNRKSH